MISVIIPVYNVEKYIKRAFDSLVNQDIGFENLEIIFVDDASTDNSSKIINDYSKKYENVKSIHLDRNSGSGGKPRNIGMSISSKEFIMFLDADDFLYEDACEVLYGEITKENIDIVSGTYTWDGITPFNPLWISLLTDPNECYKNRQSQVDELLNNKFPLKIDSIDDYESIIGDFGFVTKIYRKSFLVNNSIDFAEGILAEDSVFLLNALLNADGIKYINKVVYFYAHERNTGKDLSMSNIHSKKNLKGLLDAFFKMFLICEEKNKSKIFKHYLLFQKLEYFLASRLLRCELSVGDILDLLIESTPLFKLYVNYNNNINSGFADLFKFIANKEYEKAIIYILGEDTPNQNEIKVISNFNSFEENCNLIKLQEESWLNQFEVEKPDLFIFKQIDNEEILSYCEENNIETICADNENNFSNLLDSIKFKYIPYLKHIVIFYRLDDLNHLNDIYNHFFSINYPFKHLKLITSENNLFLSDAILESDLEELDFDDNYYFCFANLDLSPDLIKDELNISKNYNLDDQPIVFNYSKFKEVVSNNLKI